MKNLLFLTLIIISLTSLCINLPFDFLPIFNINSPSGNQTANPISIVADSQDITFKVEASDAEIKSGRSVQLFFEVNNKQNYNLDGVTIEVYDNPCFEPSTFTNVTTLKASQTKMWSLTLKSDKTIDLQKKCPIKFKFYYNAKYSLFQDLAILSEGEYTQRESTGTLGKVPFTSTSSNSPLNIGLSFSESQPLMVNTDPSNPYYMYISYLNNGQGDFENLDISIKSADNMKDLKCSDVYTGTNDLKLVPGSLVFIRNKATTTSCDFTTSDVASMDIKSLSLTANYKYVLDNSITIVVKP